MRIDYSEPRQSYVASGGTNPRSSGGGHGGSMIIAAVVAGSILFGSGFGVGWFFSQQSAKKAYRAAMEQQSLENSAKDDKKNPTRLTPLPLAPTSPVTNGTQQIQQQQGSAQQQPQPDAAAGNQGGEPLAFYENLPKGQKNTVLGSGINEKPKPIPQPVPATTTAPQKPAQQQTKQNENATAAKQPAPPPPAGYVVQVASFNSRKDAEALKAKLNAKGYNAVISEIDLKDKGIWQRVRIGRRLDKESAIKIANQLMSGAKVLPDQD